MLMANYQSHKSLTGQLGLKIREEEREVVKSTKDLSIYVVHNLNWKMHINETSKRVSRALRMLKQVKRCLPQKP